MSLTTQIHDSGKAAVLSLGGKLVLGPSATSFREAVEEILKSGQQNIVVNAAELSYADSAGVGALALNFSKVKAAGGTLAVVAPQKTLVDLMDLTRLSSLIPVFGTEQEAVASLAN